MSKGIILLHREHESFMAGFCFVNEDLSDLILSISILHPSEKAYYDTLKFDRRKTSYLLGRTAAKKAIQELHVNQTIQSFSIQFGVFQFPVVKDIKDMNVQVSISHCNNYGLALAFPEEHPLGIDIEQINEEKINLMKNFICPSEFNIIQSCSLTTLEGSIILWTIKESLSKILRTGLTVDFGIYEINSLQKDGESFISTFKYFIQYKAISIKIENYICSIVLPKNTFCNLNYFRNILLNTMIKNKL